MGTEMTATASKSGLRAKAEATRTKAAQRTPLPPKGKAENVRLAREAVAETKAKPRKTGEVLADARRAKSAAKVEEPSGKAERYATDLKALGWTPVVTRENGLAELTATRGSETIFLSWANEAHISGGSTYTIADRTVKVRNPAEAMRVAATPPAQAKAAQEKVSSNKQFRRRPTGPTIKNVPFDVETATDAEIIAILEAHEIQWHNPYRVESEKGIVGSAKGIRISRHARGHRIFSFVDPEGGYRALKLENLEHVGRKRNLEAIKAEIILSLSKKDKAA